MIEQIEKRILLTDNSFVAGGATYLIHGSVALERYVHLDDLTMRLVSGSGWADWQRGGEEWARLHNASKPHDATVLMQNMLSGKPLRRKNHQNPPEILICTLFMCPADEDRSQWNEEAANEKIKIWNAEGFPAEDFTVWGLHYVERYQRVLIGGSLDTLEAETQGMDDQS
jgi:hypothetical protein